ncbi:MAG: hypothetical protein ACLRX6_03280 [Limosilactobacillus pontis]|uniref:hypothetical protein n=1 Tax=Limosilactobacillus pontis TaxID=35787 RepID=UPI0039A1C6E5
MYQQNEPLNDEEKENIWRVIKDADERLNLSWLRIPNLQVIGLFDSQYTFLKKYLREFYINVMCREKREDDGLDMIMKPYDIIIDWRSLNMIGGLRTVIEGAHM